MHANQFWWAWPLQFRSYGSFLLAFKNGQNFPSDHGLQSMGVKKQNWLKKFMQVEVDMKCMQTNFGGRGLSSFGVMAPFCLPSKTAKISLRTMDYSPWGSKNRIGSKSSCKQRLTWNACKPILVCIASPVLEILLVFKFGQSSLLSHGLFFQSMEFKKQNQLNCID